MPFKHSLEDRARAMRIMVLEGGDSTKASALTGIPASTLRDWRTRNHADEYQRVREELETRLDRDLAEELAALARQRVEILQQLGDKQLEALARDDHTAVKDLASADRSDTTSLGILNANNRVIREKPTAYVQHRSFAELLRELRNSGAIEGTAEELDALETEVEMQAHRRESTSATPALEAGPDANA